MDRQTRAGPQRRPNSRAGQYNVLVSARSFTYDPKAALALVFACFLFGFGVVVALWALWQFTSRDLANFATFVSGTVGPLWSAAALLLLYAGFNAQQSQLEIQRREIHETSVESQRTRIEGRFYELLRLHNDQVDKLDASGLSAKGEWVGMRGKRWLYAFCSKFRSRYSKEYDDWKGMVGQDPARFRAIFADVEAGYPGSLHGYYVSVDSLLRAVENASMFDETVGRDLADLLTAQFAGFELVILFFKFHSEARFSDTLALARKYRLFRYHDEKSMWSDLESSARSAT